MTSLLTNFFNKPRRMADRPFLFFFNKKQKISADFQQQVANSLQEFISSQEKALAAADSKFLALGQDMQNLYSDTSALALKIRESAGLIAGDEDESVLTRLGLSIRDSLTTLETCQDDVGANLQHIDNLSKQLHDFYRMCPVLERIAHYLRIIGLNMCVECSQSPEATKLFMVNAHEIKKFAENVVEITGMLQDDSSTARKDLLTVHGHISQGLTELQDLAHSASQIIREAFQKIEELIQLALAAMEQASGRSQVIASQVGDIVVAIQFHDSMNQRLEHVHDSLHDAVRRCLAESEGSASEQKKPERMADLRALITLQAGQIREIISGIEEVFGQNRNAFAEIGKEVAGLAAILVSLATDRDQGLSSPSEVPADSFAALQSALHQLGPLLNQGRDQVVQMEDTGSQATETAGRLLRHIDQVRAIRHETLIKSLNSIVKACRLGQKGRAIAVLAEEMKKLSDQSGDFVVDVEKIHTRIGQAISKLQVQDQEKLAEDHTGPSLDRDIKETSQAYELFARGSATALQQARELEEVIAQISTDLDFLPTLARELSKNLGQLEELAERLSPWASELSSEAKAEAAKLATRYTMDQERLVHQQVVGADNTSFEIAAEKSPQAEGEIPAGDELDDFELFADDNDDLDGGEEATMSAAAPSDTPPGPPEERKDDDDFGDNIELF
ncbi:MAG: hypothetical protein ABFS09_09675 [Thermodesulfobacteriota bacterium]